MVKPLGRVVADRSVAVSRRPPHLAVIDHSIPFPKTRGECVDGPRPCPHVTCKHWLLTTSDETCVLDHADKKGMSLAEIAVELGISKELVARIEREALQKLPVSLREFWEER